MKKTMARLLSMVLAVIMIVSVLPLNVFAASKKEDPAFNIYKANVFANGDIGFYKDNAFSYEYIMNPRNASFQRTYYELLNSDWLFMVQVNGWEVLHDLEKPSHASASGMVSLLDYYESALFDLILNYEDEESSEKKNGSATVDEVGSKLFQTVNNSQIKYMSSIAKKILETPKDTEVLSFKTDSLTEIFKKSLDKSTKDKIEEFIVDNKSNSGIVNFNDALDFIDNAKTVFDAIMTASKYCAIKDFCDGTKEVLEYIANDKSNSATLRNAAEECLDYFEANVAKKWKNVLKTAGAEILKSVVGDIVDGVWQNIVKAIPGGEIALLAVKGIRAVLNTGFSVDKQNAAYYQLEANVKLEDAFLRAMSHFKSNYNKNKNAYASSIYLRSIDMFESNLLLGYDYAVDMINVIKNSGFGAFWSGSASKAIANIENSKSMKQHNINLYRDNVEKWYENYCSIKNESIVEGLAATETLLNSQSSISNDSKAKKYVEKAKSQNGKTGRDLGFNTAWCGYYVWWVANQTGLTNSFPSKSNCANGKQILAEMSNKGGQSTYFYNDSKIKGASFGSVDTFEPKIGDIVIFRTSKTSDSSSYTYRWAHVGIVQSVSKDQITVVHGNWNERVTVGTKFNRKGTTKYDTYYSIAGYARPNYLVNSNTSGNVNVQPTISISKVETVSRANKSATISVGLNQKASVSKWTYFVSTNKNALVNLDGTSGSTHKSTNTVTCRRILDYQANPKYEKSDTFAISKHQGEDLKPNTTYYYKVTVSINGKWYSTGVQSFKTTNYLPDATSLRVSRDSQVVGVGDSITLLWDSTKNTDTYSIEVKDVNGITVQKKTNIRGLTYTIDPISESGAYTATITSVNAVGRKVGTSAEFTVEPNRLVRFYDTVSDEVIYEESIPYGHSANAPKAPTHYGHTFSQWNRSYEKIKDSGEGDEHIITVNTVYDLNTYTVRFIDAFTNEIISSQSVKYKKSAVAPVSLPEHKGFEFISWDKGYSSIEKDTDIYTVYQWEDPDHLAILTIDGVTRTIPKENSEENVGYDVSVTISNSAERIISGRVVAVLKSAEGTILSQSESAAFAVDKAPMNESGSINGTTDRQVTFTVLYDDFAPQIELYLINDYDKLGQLAPMVSTDIDNTGVWSGLIRFEGDEPPVQSDSEKGITVAVEGPFNETIKYYRYRILEKSYDTSAPTAGYTQSGYTKVNAQKKSVDYVASWPSGFLKTNSLYTQYNKQPVTASETATQITEVSSPTTKGYIYYHWCMGTYANGPINRGINGSKTSTYKQFHAFYTTPAISFDSSAKAYKKSVSGTCKDTYWWYGLTPDKSGNIIVKTQNYTVYDKLYNYYSEYSEWIPYVGECPLANGALVDGDANKTYEVETKTETNEYYCYKYCMNNTPEEPVFSDDDPRVVSISGTVGSEFEAKTATIWVYKYSQASDYTTEYVGNTVVGSEGQVSIERAVLREAPSVQSGDYTIVVSVPGQEQALHLGTIKAPKAKYTVTFEDYFGNVISTQVIGEGDSASVPDSSLTCAPDGYRFVRWSESVVNVRGNLTVKPEFEKKTFVVAFVDWNDQSVVLNENVEYGSELVSISSPAEIEGYDTEWVVQIDDQYLTIEEFTDSGYTVTGNMVVTTRNTPKDYSVIFLDADPEVVLENKLQTIDSDKLSPIGISENTDYIAVLANTTVTYGIGIDYSSVIEIEESDNLVFMGWINAETGESLDSTEISESVVLYPRYTFAETVATPTASMDSGEYYETIEVELTPEFTGASIWYTLDGSDPKSSDTAIEYTEPLTINQSCVLQYYSGALGYNDSKTGVRYYAINFTDENRQHVVTVFAVTNEGLTLINEGITRLVEEGALLPSDMYSGEFEGFSGCTLYRYFDFYEEFDPMQDVIYDSITLYAFYEPIEYTVTFYGFTGNVLSSQEISFGNSALAPYAPAVDGWLFAGWDGDYSFVDGNLDIFARYITLDEYATISLDKKAITLNVGASYANLQTAITPVLHSDYDILWYSSNEDIASVDENGIITALSVGIATITAKLPYTGETAEVTVKVAYDLDREIVLMQGSSIGFDSNRNLRVTPNVDHTADGILAAFANSNLSICKADGTELSGTDLVGTGCVVKLVSGDELIDFATVVLTGDFNGDGAINNKDVVMLNQLVLEKREADLWQMVALDVNGDGYVNNKDCAMLARYLVGKEVIG